MQVLVQPVAFFFREKLSTLPVYLHELHFCVSEGRRVLWSIGVWAQYMGYTWGWHSSNSCFQKLNSIVECRFGRIESIHKYLQLEIEDMFAVTWLYGIFDKMWGFQYPTKLVTVRFGNIGGPTGRDFIMSPVQRNACNGNTYLSINFWYAYSPLHEYPLLTPFKLTMGSQENNQLWFACGFVREFSTYTWPDNWPKFPDQWDKKRFWEKWVSEENLWWQGSSCRRERDRFEDFKGGSSGWDDKERDISVHVEMKFLQSWIACHISPCEFFCCDRTTQGQIP